MTQKDEAYASDSKKADYSDAATPSSSSHPTSTADQTAAPPAYSEHDPQNPSEAPPPFVATKQTDLVVDKKGPQELMATKGFDFEHPIYIHTSGVTRTDITIEPDTNQDNEDTIDKTEFTVHLNEHNEYDFHVNVGWSFWNMFSVYCRIVVRAPSTAVRSHPGIRAEAGNGRIDMVSLPNIGFSKIDLKTTNSSASVSAISGKDIHVKTSNGALKVAGVNASSCLVATTSNGELGLENVTAPVVQAHTSNGSLSLVNVTTGNLLAETKNAKITGTDVKAPVAQLKTSNASIDIGEVSADELRIVTSNAKVDGTWSIKRKLDIATSNASISGTIKLADPATPARMSLSTSCGSINARLPTDAFSGTIDMRTSCGEVSFSAAGFFADPPPMKYIVNEKQYKRAMVGNGQHELVAKTSNSNVNVKFY
ncbi:hypothetical protein DL89DRAFT_260489 [Linderina pennispora]|uniref:Uncharacterized protein n=1 Tax=Linderina pennispora TaxID=61395 RepID=A0A1Y1VY76_9FUNG|nr:uncharacterized protein DL89DRAFT_260489 [Linderina pennispora]ORX66197.1 hypothetical protein DL89DRAFT_260489 [Linderina pennispora]